MDCACKIKIARYVNIFVTDNQEWHKINNKYMHFYGILTVSVFIKWYSSVPVVQDKIFSDFQVKVFCNITMQ